MNPPSPVFTGSLKQAGTAYGQLYQKEIAGFFQAEYGGYRGYSRVVRSHSRMMEEHAPNVVRFFEGVSRSSLLSYEQHVLLLLHEEELYHRNLAKKMPHCTVVGVRRRDGSVFLAQNWDWSSAYLPWGAVNTFRFTKKPTICALSFPGLPVSAGMNSAGLSVLWTGSGYYPPVMPKAGVPTYALLFEILLRKNIDEALRYLEYTPNAGAFILFLGDTDGKFVVIEGVPGKMIVDDVEFAHRANVFEFAESIKLSNQKLPRSEKRCHSLLRNRLLCERAPRRPSQAGPPTLQKMLSQEHIRIDKRFNHATLFQVTADCKKKELVIQSWADDFRRKRYRLNHPSH